MFYCSFTDVCPSKVYVQQLKSGVIVRTLSPGSESEVSSKKIQLLSFVLKTKKAEKEFVVGQRGKNFKLLYFYQKLGFYVTKKLLG